MQKFTFWAGAGLGFVIGSWLGRGPYEQLQSTVVRLVRRPEVHEPVEQIKTAARQRVSAGVQKASAQMASVRRSGSSDRDGDLATSPPPATGVAPPEFVDRYPGQQDEKLGQQDVELGKAAAEMTIP